MLAFTENIGSSDWHYGQYKSLDNKIYQIHYITLHYHMIVIFLLINYYTFTVITTRAILHF